jgi:hypothetical protein
VSDLACCLGTTASAAHILYSTWQGGECRPVGFYCCWPGPPAHNVCCMLTLADTKSQYGTYSLTRATRLPAAQHLLHCMAHRPPGAMCMYTRHQ